MSSPQTKLDSNANKKNEPYSHLIQQADIRVLDLSPGRWDHPLHGTLRTVSLDTVPSYEALSYTWGSRDEGKSIRINKVDVKVKSNLFQALKRLRGKVFKRTLWVDALCIDQDDFEERNRQVAMMGRLYGLAVTVLVWIGEYPNAKSTDSWNMRRPHRTRVGAREVLNSRGIKVAAALDAALRDAEPKWHSRAWVIQEFVLARELFLCFGPVSMVYEAPRIIDLLLTPPARRLEHLQAFHERTNDMVKLKVQLGVSSQSISDAALFTSSASCWDPRDRVYSLLGLIDPREAKAIGTNYVDAPEVIFAKATYTSIVKQNDFAVLQLINLRRSLDPSLPSWVVDFTSEQDISEIAVHRYVDRYVQWPRSLPANAWTACLDQSAKTLTVNGTHFDIISEILPVPDVHITTSGQPAMILAADLIPFLLRLFKSRDLRTPEARSTQKPDDFVNVTMLLPGGTRTQILVIMKIVFTVWSDVASFAVKHRRHDFKPFWECDSEEKYMRQGTAGGRETAYFPDWAAAVSDGCKFFTTSQGFVGIAPATLTLSDRVVLVVNSKMPMILQSSGDHWLFRGFAWVHGIMDGELLEEWKDRGVEHERFVLC